MEFFEAVRIYWASHLVRLDQPVFGWTLAIALGETGYLERGVVDAFKKIGIYHLLVLSGLHLSLILGGLFRLIEGPARFLYGFGVLRYGGFRLWQRGHFIFSLMVAGTLMVFFGAGVSIQRAALLFALNQVAGRGLSTAKRYQVYGVGLLLHISLNREGVFGLGGLLSWGSFLLLVTMQRNSFVGFILTHLLLSCWQWLCLGQFSIFWPLISMGMTFIFPFFLLLALLFVLGVPLPNDLYQAGQSLFLDTAMSLADQVPPPLFLDQKERALFIPGMIFLLIMRHKSYAACSRATTPS